MNIDEYAAFEKAVGGKVRKVNGVWWRESKPFFFRPLNIFQELEPEKSLYPWGFRIGGVQHVVPNDGQTNCLLGVFVFPDVQNYSLEGLNHVRRRRIKRGLENFHIKTIREKEEFIRWGYQIYLSFYQRTHYSYLKKRKNEEGFKKWAQTLFAFPKILLLGAYQDEKLSAVSVSMWVEKLLIHSTFFSTDESLKLYAADALLHTIREKVRDYKEIKYIYLGMITGRKGIDTFKQQRGSTLLWLPARYQVNPLLLNWLRFFRRSQYNRLLGREDS